MVMPLKDLTGMRFGRLRVIRRANSPTTRQAMWICQCSCGSHRTLFGYVLRTGKQTSCGCGSFISPANRHLNWIEEKRAAGWTYAKMLKVKPGLAANAQALREAVFKARQRRLKERVNLVEETVKHVFDTARGDETNLDLSARTLAKKLGISERHVVRLKSKPREGSLRCDYETVRKWRLFRGESWNEINALLGRPYKTAAELERAWNLEADRRAGLLDFSEY